MIIYTCRGGRRPPGYRERLSIDDDGSFRMWRSVGMASNPPSPVGLFEGRIDATTTKELQGLVSQLGSVGDLNLTPAPDSPIETYDLTVGRAVLGLYAAAPNPWGDLIATVRPLLGLLTDQPRAAVELQIIDDSRDCELAHLGSDPLDIDLRSVRVTATLWHNDDIEDRWTAPTEHIGDLVRAGPGWTFDLPFDHGWHVTAEQRIAVEVMLAIAYESDLTNVALQT